MKIAITGSSGFIGTAFKRHLEAQGNSILRVLRRGSRLQAEAGDASWDFERPEELGRQLEGADAVVHFAGAVISDHRWTASYKREILESRVQGTQNVALALAGMKKKPKVLLSPSAVGYYGPRGSEAVDESAGPGDDFLAKVC